jgi:hypothetical protein
MTPVEILRAAKAKIERPENWCQFAIARDITGRAVSWDDLSACRWCASGAVRAAAGEESCTAHSILNVVAGEINPTWVISDVNDDRDHPTVLRMFDRAIELAEQEAPK